MTHRHEFPARVIWTGNKGEGTSRYRAYERTWDMHLPGKAVLHCSNDPMLGGDPAKYNPEDILISALSSCHMLWYLHLCSSEKIIVTSYEDEAVGIGESEADGSGQFTEAILRPTIHVTDPTMIDRAEALHEEIHKYCFIARSVNFPVRYEPKIFVSAS